MDSFKRVVGTSILALARFLDAHFYQIAAVFVGLAIFNYFFIKNYDKILLESARKGVVKDVKDALRNEADVNTQQNGDCTPLMLACEGKHEEIAQILIDTGKCKVDVVDSKGRTALSIASAVGIVDTVKLLLRNKGDVKSSDNNGDTPLNVACQGGHAEVVKALLAFNSEPRWKNKNGVNALAAAISAHKEEGGRLPVIKELLSYSFKRDLGIVESRSASTGWTPLIRASYKGFSDVARMLLDYNADIHAQGKKGFTALIAASQNGWKDTVRLLLERGADPLMSLEDGSTATIAASYGGYHEIVDLLVSANEDCMNGRFKNGSTPLMTAALNGHLSVVQVLLKHGVEVNARNEDSWSALAVAAQKGCLQITKLLLAAHAEVDAVTDRGYTPLMLAVKAGHLELTKVLVEHGAQVNHFRFDWLEDKLAPAKIPLLYGYLSPLMLAINTGDVALIEFLLQQEADLSLDLAQIIPHSESPKDKYTQEGHEALKKALRLAEEAEAALKLIVEKGETTQRLRNANNYRDAQTAVEVAGKRLEQFQDEQIQQQQALRDATLVYTHFSTPLLFAVYWDNPEIVRMLMAAASTGQSGSEAAVCDAGAASTSAGGLVPALLAQRNVHDLSAIELAVAYGYPQMVLLLMEYGATLPFDAEAVRLWAKLLYRWQFVAIARISCYAMYQRLFWRKPASPAVLPAASKSKDD